MYTEPGGSDSSGLLPRIGGIMKLKADKDRVDAYADLVFAKLGFGADRAAYRNPLPGLSLSARANAALTYQLFIVEMGGVYEAFRWARIVNRTRWAACLPLLEQFDHGDSRRIGQR